MMLQNRGKQAVDSIGIMQSTAQPAHGELRMMNGDPGFGLCGEGETRTSLMGNKRVITTVKVFL